MSSYRLEITGPSGNLVGETGIPVFLGCFELSNKVPLSPSVEPERGPGND